MSGIKSSKTQVFNSVNTSLIRANSTLFTGYKSILDPDVYDYVLRITAIGETISPSTVGHVDDFVRSLKNSGVWSRILDMSIYCGDSLKAALVKLKTAPGSPDTLTNVNFIEHDYVERGLLGGLQGDGATKYLKTSVYASQTAIDNVSMSVYNKGKFLQGNTTMGISNSNSSKLMMHYPYVDGRIYSDIYNQTTTQGRAYTSNPILFDSGVGHIISTRASQTSHKIYRNGVTVASNTTFGGDFNSLKPYDFYYFNVNVQNQPIQNDSSSYIESFHHIGYGLTDGQSLSFYTAVQKLQIALGRNI